MRQSPSVNIASVISPYMQATAQFLPAINAYTNQRFIEPGNTTHAHYLQTAPSNPRIAHSHLLACTATNNGHTESSISSKASLRTSIQLYNINSLHFQQPSLHKFTPGGLFLVWLQRGPGGIYKNRPSFYSPICNGLFKLRLNFRAARQIVSSNLFRAAHLFFSTRRYNVIHAVYIAVMVLSKEDRGNRI